MHTYTDRETFSDGSPRVLWKPSRRGNTRGHPLRHFPRKFNDAREEESREEGAHKERRKKLLARRLTKWGRGRRRKSEGWASSLHRIASSFAVVESRGAELKSWRTLIRFFAVLFQTMRNDLSSPPPFPPPLHISLKKELFLNQKTQENHEILSQEGEFTFVLSRTRITERPEYFRTRY